ncbi:Superoxide dismutase [Cu-Zn] 2 [Durusdinium trenchii]|uniref:Superoxide dismutase [Cu-Zn] 2 n=1 Tax=Durusdinium trenchii TaxID=1381693 RepID=A0ABP0I406_9DINO
MAEATAVCTLIGADGPKGVVTFTPEGGKTRVSGQLSGLSPGKHGFHIHQFGDTTNGCASTGGHYNPSGKTHGAPSDDERHAGDLGNIEAGADGVAKIDITDAQIPISEIVGRAVVCHDGEDDLGAGGHELSKTTGNAGGRFCCGIIGLQAPPK